jgi:hypothetical protein
MWLRDRLPKDIPGARTLTWGYDLALLSSEWAQSMADFGINFRDALRWVSSNGVTVSLPSYLALNELKMTSRRGIQQRLIVQSLFWRIRLGGQ